MNLVQLITRLHNESIEAGHDLGNFASFLRVCCGRYLALQLSGDIPDDLTTPIAALDSARILDKERGRMRPVAPAGAGSGGRIRGLSAPRCPPCFVRGCAAEAGGPRGPIATGRRDRLSPGDRPR